DVGAGVTNDRAGIELSQHALAADDVEVEVLHAAAADLDERRLAEQGTGHHGRQRVKPAMHDVYDVVLVAMTGEPRYELERPREERSEAAAAEIRRRAQAETAHRQAAVALDPRRLGQQPRGEDRDLHPAAHEGEGQLAALLLCAAE